MGFPKMESRRRRRQMLLLFSLYSLLLITFASAQEKCVDSQACLNNAPVDSQGPHHDPSSEPKEFVKAAVLPKLVQLDPNIKKICDSTDYPDICVTAVTPFLNGKTDPLSVAEMAIKSAVVETKNAISMATKMATAPTTNHEIASILEDCRDNYSDALDNFKSALEALPAKDTGTMNSMLSAAITDFSDCTDELAGQSSQLLEFNDKLTKMTSNCLAIVSLIK